MINVKKATILTLTGVAFASIAPNVVSATFNTATTHATQQTASLNNNHEKSENYSNLLNRVKNADLRNNLKQVVVLFLNNGDFSSNQFVKEHGFHVTSDGHINVNELHRLITFILLTENVQTSLNSPSLKLNCDSFINLNRQEQSNFNWLLGTVEYALNTNNFNWLDSYLHGLKPVQTNNQGQNAVNTQVQHQTTTQVQHPTTTQVHQNNNNHASFEVYYKLINRIKNESLKNNIKLVAELFFNNANFSSNQFVKDHGLHVTSDGHINLNEFHRLITYILLVENVQTSIDLSHVKYNCDSFVDLNKNDRDNFNWLLGTVEYALNTNNFSWLDSYLNGALSNHNNHQGQQTNINQELIIKINSVVGQIKDQKIVNTIKELLAIYNNPNLVLRNEFIEVNHWNISSNGTISLNQILNYAELMFALQNAQDTIANTNPNYKVYSINTDAQLLSQIQNLLGKLNNDKLIIALNQLIAIRNNPDQVIRNELVEVNDLKIENNGKISLQTIFNFIQTLIAIQQSQTQGTQALTLSQVNSVNQIIELKFDFSLSIIATIS